MRQVMIYPGQDGFWVAECPSLPGCISQGETREAAIGNIREAIEAYISALEDDYKDLQALKEAKKAEQNAPTMSLAEVKEKLGVSKTRSKRKQ